MGITTIKIPVQLRDRINADARAQGSTVAALLDDALDVWEREQRAERMRQMKSAMAAASPDEVAAYLAEFHEFEAITASPLTDD